MSFLPLPYHLDLVGAFSYLYAMKNTDLIRIIIVFIILVLGIWFLTGCEEVYQAFDPNWQPPEETAPLETQTFPDGPETRN